MEIEKNVIFLYPLAKVLQELQAFLEEDDSFVVYEMDSIAEYGQLIGIMEQSITFSSDLKKTQSYLEASKELTKSKASKNIYVQDKTLPPHIFGKLQRLGLNEAIKSDVKLKNLTHKVNFFFSNLEQGLIEEEKQEKKIDTNEVLRVEKMAVLEEEPPELKVKKSKHNLNVNTMLGGGAKSNFELRTNSDKNNPLLKSPFDSFQLKKVKTFDPVDAPSKKKNSSFTPVEQEYGNNPHKNLGLKESGELNRKKVNTLDLTETELNKRRADFEEVEKDLNKKNAKFKEVEREINKKRSKFEEAHNNLKKKRTSFDEALLEPKKKKLFEEVMGEYDKKRAKLDELDLETKKKRNKFEEVDQELNKKKKMFDEVELDNPKKEKLLLELEDLQKKKGATFEEYEAALQKKKGFVEEDLDPNQLPKHKIDEIEDPSKKKNIQFEEAENYDKKKNAFLESEDPEKNKKSFDEVILDNEKKPGLVSEIEEEDNKKKTKFEEVENESKNTKSRLEEVESEKKKSGNFEEIALESKRDVKPGGEALKNKNQLDSLEVVKKAKEYEEEVLDYSKFKQNKSNGQYIEEGSEEEHNSKIKLQSILDEPEYTFFDNQSFGVEYLVFYNDFLLKENILNTHLFKFIHFGLIKEYDGDVSFYLTDSQNTEAPLKYLYSGHKARKNIVLKNDYIDFEKENMKVWLEQKLPVWKDETYQIEINEFIYPFYEDGQLLGFAVCHFRNTIKSHIDAQKVELLIISLKGAMLEEFSSGGS